MINGLTLKNAFISGANNISKHKNMVNDLNIFPVPDGDTGTNMSMTMSAAANELIKTESTHAGEIAKIAASALLRGARAQFRCYSFPFCSVAFQKEVKGKETISGIDLANALGLGVEDAYKAVMKPTEGTILTVSRVACEKGKAAAAIEDDAVYVWSAICKGAAEALETTPELLPVLKKAGVVDAGGKGLCLILEVVCCPFSKIMF
ncbi:MAG: DAK2 domain-containing protein [Eubacteriales bacterium]